MMRIGHGSARCPLFGERRNDVEIPGEVFCFSQAHHFGMFTENKDSRVHCTKYKSWKMCGANLLLFDDSVESCRCFSQGGGGGA